MLRTRLVAGVTSGFVLSAVCATVLTLVSFSETFVEPLRVEPSRPAPVTLRLPPRATMRVPKSGGVARFVTDNAIIGRGTTTHSEPLATMVRVFEHERRPPRPTLLLAHWFASFLLFSMTAMFMRRASNPKSGLLRTQVGLFAWTMMYLIAAKVFLLVTSWPALVLPVAVLPLWTAFFLDRRSAVLWSVVSSLLTASLISFDPVNTAVFFAIGTTGTFWLRDHKHYSALLVGGLAGGLAATVAYVVVREIFGGLDWSLEIQRGMQAGPLAAMLGGVMSGVMAFALRPFVARTIGIVTRNQLLNLSDLDNPLLRKMAREAPGSWEHSRAMANLAEAASASIGANALLTRVGAYYHDLGKSCQPKYYIENLDRGERSPHEDLPPEVSADAIMAHVVEGVRILREGGIPEPVIEFAYTHHGTSVIEYFWHKCLKQGNPQQLTQAAFCYPGMKPRTKETAILMLIDSIEAGARTVNPPTRDNFEEMVRRVIFVKLQQGQLDESGLSVKNLHVLASRITDTLCNAYHSRIRYPWQDARANGDTALANNTQDHGRSAEASQRVAIPERDDTPTLDTQIEAAIDARTSAVPEDEI